jgi:hypothetical protein
MGLTAITLAEASASASVSGSSSPSNSSSSCGGSLRAVPRESTLSNTLGSRRDGGWCCLANPDEGTAIDDDESTLSNTLG